ncbi:nuclear transport factor 2 family protein [Streptomyces chiangmaiensis]|uniref:Nuclear transport factor 2 family protein n=1 Tax=Streptomyces chiangmaiensis TaxID=766497 RepID=A0ABU7FQG6_9ACTN|nr:nuclear transport factor 2 family protein [Streptomyces chiangmaiensis]MED7825369.1 nuclear transport factor 2 family protein [Streptomyces chiangmaiensis]
MGTAAGTAFDTHTLRHGVEDEDAQALLSLYTDDAEIRIVDRHSQPSHPKILRGRNQIGEMLADVYSRDMSHHLDRCVVQGDHVAFTESCRYRDGVRVLANSMASLRDGKIAEQILLQAWDE